MGDGSPLKSALDRLGRDIREAEERGRKDRAFFADAKAHDRNLPQPPAEERALVEAAVCEIKNFVDFLWPIYTDPEQELWRTRYQRGEEPVIVDVGAQAAEQRAIAKQMLEQMFAQMGASVKNAARIGVMVRIKRLADGKVSEKVKRDGVMSFYDDEITDAELLPLVKIWNETDGGPKKAADGKGKWKALRHLLEKHGDKTTVDALRKAWNSFLGSLEKSGRRPSD